MWQRWGLRVRILLFFALIALGGGAVIGAASWFGYSRIESSGPVSAFVLSSIIASFTLVGLVTWVWLLFDENVAKPLERLASDMRARAHAKVEKELDSDAAKYLGDIAPAASAVTSNLTETRTQLAEAVARETEAIARERERLATVLRDFPAGIVICGKADQMVLYNTQAVALLGESGELGLDRPLFGLLRPDPIRHARERMQRRINDDSPVDLLCTTVDGARVLRGQMRLLGETPAEPDGYVLLLNDITEGLAADAARHRLLHEVIEGIRRPATNLHTTLDILTSDEALTAEERTSLQQAMVTETEALVSRIVDYSARYDRAATGWWPLSDVRSADLGDAFAARMEASGIRADVSAAPLMLRCDAFALVLLLGQIMEHLRADTGLRDVTLRVEPEGEGAELALSWEGAPLAVTKLENWLDEPLGAGYGTYTGRDALESHGTDLWPERRPDGETGLRLPLRKARPDSTGAQPPARKEFYDFSLFDADAPGTGDDRPLSSLRYVVFDTETTGLRPSEGDEIVQIAAVRIVNGRLLTGETFDRLVNPERRIPSFSTEVHGITEEMVRDAPTIDRIGKRFHAFCSDAVLIAHNAPFDMAFLHRHEKRIGARFDHPVLDTVLLSAILFGESAEHTLDAVAERLAVTIPSEVRHTALGDSLATAEVFVRMLPMLPEKGVHTLGDAIQAFKAHKRLLELPERRSA